MDTGMSRYQNY